MIKDILIMFIIIILMYINLIINKFVFDYNHYLGLLMPIISLIIWCVIIVTITRIKITRVNYTNYKKEKSNYLAIFFNKGCYHWRIPFTIKRGHFK